MNSINNEDYIVELLINSKKYAESLSQNDITLKHIVITFFNDNDVISLINNSDNDIDCENLIFELKELLTDTENNSDIIEHFKSYYYTCNLCNKSVIDDTKIAYIINVLSSILFVNDECINNVLMKHGINHDFLIYVYQENCNNKINDQIVETIKNEGISNLKKYVEKYNPTSDNTYFIGREEELKFAKQILLKKEKSNILILGEKGIGKTTFVNKLFKEIYATDNTVNFYILNLLEIFCNLISRGEIELRIKNICDYINESNNKIVFIDNTDFIFNNNDYLFNSDIIYFIDMISSLSNTRMILSTSLVNENKFDKLPIILSDFTKMVLNELPSNDVYNILMNKKNIYEEYFQCTYSDEIIKTIIKLSNKFLIKSYFPNKAFEIMDMAGAISKYENINIVNVNHLYKAVSRITGLSLDNISINDAQLYLTLEDKIKQEIKGQDDIISKIIDYILIYKSGLRDNNKTAMSLMFIGSTGVGKTEMCRTLSTLLNIPLIRFDMSEYTEEHSVSKLLGAPPGYKGYDEGRAGGGLLITEVNKNPHCIVLLDEIEKAHFKIHNLLLQIMDNGKITSSSGKEVSFEHVYLIMTSNVGASVSHKRKIGFNSEDNSLSNEEYKMTFLPEFRSRIDEVFTFHKLNETIMKDICTKFFNELKNILLEKNIIFNYTTNIINYVVNKALIENNGARPLKHIINKEIKNKIAKSILLNNVNEINADIINNEISIEVK